MPSKELIEKVARNICDGDWDAKDFNGTPNGESPDDFREYWKSIAETAISTILAVLQEPTQGMVRSVKHDLAWYHAKETWISMLTASPLGEQSE